MQKKSQVLSNKEGRAALVKKTAKHRGRGLESIQQELLVNWFRQTYPQFAKQLFAIPNAGKRSKRQGAIMKKEGLLPGAPDLFLAVPLPDFFVYGLFIEYKTEIGKMRDNQKEIKEILINTGYSATEAYGLECAKQIIINYLEHL